MAHCSGQGQAQPHCQLGVQMACFCFNMIFGKDQSEQQDKIGEHMATCLDSTLL